MNRDTIFNYIQAHAPADIQFVDPYLSKVPPPKGNYCSLQILPIEDVGNSQYRNLGASQEGGGFEFEYSQERIYTVQFDCYGDSGCMDMALNIRSTLKDFFNHNTGTLFNLKEITNLENLSFLCDNKSYIERYEFRMSFFVIDKRIEHNVPCIDKVVPILEHIAI